MDNLNLGIPSVAYPSFKPQRGRRTNWYIVSAITTMTIAGLIGISSLTPTWQRNIKDSCFSNKTVSFWTPNQTNTSRLDMIPSCESWDASRLVFYLDTNVPTPSYIIIKGTSQQFKQSVESGAVMLLNLSEFNAT